MLLLRSPRTVGSRLLTVGELLWIVLPCGVGADCTDLVEMFELQPDVATGREGG